MLLLLLQLLQPGQPQWEPSCNETWGDCPIASVLGAKVSHKFRPREPDNKNSNTNVSLQKFGLESRDTVLRTAAPEKPKQEDKSQKPNHRKQVSQKNTSKTKLLRPTKPHNQKLQCCHRRSRRCEAKRQAQGIKVEQQYLQCR